MKSLEMEHMGILLVKTRMLTFLAKITNRNMSMLSFAFVSISNVITPLKYHDYYCENSNKNLCDIGSQHSFIYQSF